MNRIDADFFIQGTRKLDKVKGKLELLVRGLMGLIPDTEDEWRIELPVPNSEDRWVITNPPRVGLCIKYETPRSFSTSPNRQHVRVYAQYAKQPAGSHTVEETESLERVYAARQVLCDGVSEAWPALCESAKVRAIIAAGTNSATYDDY